MSIDDNPKTQHAKIGAALLWNAILEDLLNLAIHVADTSVNRRFGKQIVFAHHLH